MVAKQGEAARRKPVQRRTGLTLQGEWECGVVLTNWLHRRASQGDGPGTQCPCGPRALALCPLPVTLGGGVPSIVGRSEGVGHAHQPRPGSCLQNLRDPF